jgi:mRNA-degrading endonuclease RelE of RelBE toxin-antitoxin system
MLKGEPNTRRLPVGPFRALFELDRVVRKVRVLRVPDRKDAY